MPFTEAERQKQHQEGQPKVAAVPQHSEQKKLGDAQRPVKTESDLLQERQEQFRERMEKKKRERDERRRRYSGGHTGG